jgi:hypothetical protein
MELRPLGRVQLELSFVDAQQQTSRAADDQPYVRAGDQQRLAEPREPDAAFAAPSPRADLLAARRSAGHAR